MKKKIPPENPKGDWEILRRLFKVTRFRLTYFIIPLLFSMAALIFETCTIGLLMPFVKGVLEKNFIFVYQNQSLRYFLELLHLPQNSTSQKTIFVLLVGGIFLSAILKNVAQYLAQVILDKKIFQFLNSIRTTLFKRLMSFRKDYFDQSNSGTILENLITVTIDAVVIIKGAYRQFCSLLMLVPYFLIMLWISWPLTILSLIMAPLFQIGVTKLISKIKESSRVFSRYQNELAGAAANVMNNIGLVKVLRTEEQENERFVKLSERVSHARFRVEKKQSLVPAVNEMATLTALLIILGAMAFMVKYGIAEDIAQLLVFFLVLKRALGCFSSLTHLRASFSRLSGPLLIMEMILSDEGKPFESEGEKSQIDFCKEIRFENVSSSYRDDVWILQNVNVSFERGHRTAIVGASGSGKTTLMNLLLRLYDPNKGRILIDGQDVREFRLDALRGCFALVSQETFLFHDTIRNNLVYGAKREILEEDITEALKKARLDDFVQTLPKGLETLIGDRGVRLSGGEKQRLSIARAILRKSPVFIFDEATSALDSVTERLVQEAIEDISEGHTTIMIAHRLSTIRNVDKVIVLEKGRVVEEGTLESLLKAKGKFHTYWQEQNAGEAS